MLPRGITIAAALSILSCASAAPRVPVSTASGSLVVGVRSDLGEQDLVRSVEISLDGETIADLGSQGSGEEWTAALEAGETRVFEQPVPGPSRIRIQVSALVGEQSVTQALELEMPPRTVAVLVTLHREHGRVAIRIEKVALSTLESGEMCTEPELPEPACG
jgi:hypothetical protein